MYGTECVQHNVAFTHRLDEAKKNAHYIYRTIFDFEEMWQTCLGMEDEAV